MKKQNPDSMIRLIDLLERKKANLQKRIDVLKYRLESIHPEFIADPDLIQRKVTKLQAEVERQLKKEHS